MRDPKGRSRRQGLLVVYTGHGKGKSTSAFGVVFRALGRGMRVAVVQFIKGKWKTGEGMMAERLPELTWVVSGQGFTWESDDLTRDADAAKHGWARAQQLITEGEHDLVLLDEVTYPLNYGFVSVDDVLSVLARRPRRLHVLVTGRKAPQALIDAADLVTEMKPIKHPFDSGIPAQLGLDY